MTPHATNALRATTAAHAQPQSSAYGAPAQAHRPGDQVAHYKGATLRTAFAGGRPGGMAKAMLAKLKPRPAPPGAAREGIERTDGAGSAADGDARARRSEEGDATDPQPHGTGARDRGSDERGGSSRDGDEASRDDGDGDGAPTASRRYRVRSRGAPAAMSPVRGGAAALRAEWAVTAMASGGEAALQRALATRLFQVARGPGTVGWRRPWLGNVGAVHAAVALSRVDADSRIGAHTSADTRTAAGGLAGVREVLVGLSANAGGHRLLPNPMRATFFCLLPLVLLDLQRPRTARQRQDLLVRLAALARVATAARPF